MLSEHHSVLGGYVKITRSGATTIYEMSIPKSGSLNELALFDPSKMDRFRFSFVVGNGERAALTDYDVKEDMDNKMQYARGYGVFDHWNKYCSSFVESWVPMQPCQTWFGIEGGSPLAPEYAMPSDETPLFNPSGEGTAVQAHDAGQVSGRMAIAVPVRTEKIFGRKSF
jgi:hypothetical protein